MAVSSFAGELKEGFKADWKFLLVLMVIFYLIAQFVLLPSAKDKINVNGQEIVIIKSNHAVTKHGDGAILSRRCFDHHGTWDIFVSRENPDMYQLVCRDTLGNFYTWVIEKIKDNVFREKTAYQYGSRNWTQIKNTITKFGQYTRYKGPLVPPQ